MDQQVRKAADGRGEVGVAGGGEGKVAVVDLRVARLFERAQHEVAEDALLGLAGDFGGELLVHRGGDGDLLRDLDLAGLGAVRGGARVGGAVIRLDAEARDGQRSDAERIAEGGGEVFKIVDALGVGRLVDAVDGSNALVFEVGGHGFIGREHELLDQAMGEEPLGAGDAFHQAVLVELDERLGKIEVDGAAALALLVEDLSQLLHEEKIFDQRGVTLAGRGVAIENELDGLVGHALGAADDAGHDLVGEDFAARVDLHDAGEDEAIDAADAASRCRWIARWAAWGWRGPENTRWCRGSRPRGRCPCRGGRSERRRRCGPGVRSGRRGACGRKRHRQSRARFRHRW